MRPVPDARRYLVFGFDFLNEKVRYASSYLLHPKIGGAHQHADQTQENTIPAVAHLASNLTFPKGLHTTTHLSQEMIVSDQRAAIPVLGRGVLITEHTCSILLQTLGALTTDGDNITLKDAHRMSQNEVAKKLIAHTNSAGKNCLSKISNGEIDQDPV